MRIFLLGFMGSGKSTIGLTLAKQLSYSFIDLDILIQEEENQSIQEIFANKGEAHFRDLESHYLRTNVNKDNTVIALGGGAPCHDDNMEWINKNGISIYLNVSEAVLFDRLKNKKNKRPLLKGFNDKALQAFISTKLNERQIHYKKAQHTINRNNDSIAEILKLTNFLKNQF